MGRMIQTRCAVCLLLLLVGGSLLEGGTLVHAAQPGDRSDQRLEERVRSALAASGFGDAVRVRVRARVVYLSGPVDDARGKVKAIQAAFSISEVESVESELQILRGVTPGLEEAIWLALFSKGLEGFISDVLVREGIATIRGDVPDQRTRERLLKAARGVPGIDSVEDELKVVSAPAAEASPPPTVSPPFEPEGAKSTVVEPEPANSEPPVAAAAGESPWIENTTSTPSAQARDVAIAILTSPGYSVFDYVQFSLEGVEVVLHGAVTALAKKQELQSRVRVVTGIGNVKNEIRVLPDSKDDRRLREKLFRRIYEDPLFAPFADDPNPPVHILVDGGLVTLPGVVDETIQQMSAEAIVRNVFEVTIVQNRIRVRNR
jgi:osmotically-inducible protein OsmY